MPHHHRLERRRLQPHLVPDLFRQSQAGRLDHLRRLPHQCRPTTRLRLHELPHARQDQHRLSSPQRKELRLQQRQLLLVPSQREGWIAMRSTTIATLLIWRWAARRLRAVRQRAHDRYHVKFVAEGVVYLDGGRAVGLAEAHETDGPPRPGHRRQGHGRGGGRTGSALGGRDLGGLRDQERQGDDPAPATSPTCRHEDAQTLQMLRTGASSRKYAQVVTFTRATRSTKRRAEYMPHPKLEEVNRVRGRIGFEYNSIRDGGGVGHPTRSASSSAATSPASAAATGT